MSETTTITQDALAGPVGRLAVERGLITPAQLEEARLERSFAAASGSRGDGLLGALLVSKGYLTIDQLEALVSEIVRTEKKGAGPGEPAPPSPRAEGPTLGAFGKYTLLRVLGRGGMGVVYEARDRALDRHVALKIMSLRKTDDETNAGPDTRRFVKEARLSANLPKHPNIATVYDAGILEGKRYIAMELVQGRPMAIWRTEGNIPLRKQIQMLRDVALGVHYAHEQGIVHRDLKPSNILIDAEGTPVITDFGLAKSMMSEDTISLTPHGFVVGSPQYMSPEQASGRKDIDCRTDVYALGVMLYEILTGRLPFEGKKALEVLLKVVEETAVSPAALAEANSLPPVDRILNRICWRAIWKNPDKRHQTAREFAERLTNWLEKSEVVPARRRVKKVTAWALGIAAAAAAAVLLVVAAVALFQYLANREETRQRDDADAHLETIKPRPKPESIVSSGLIAYWKLDEGKGSEPRDVGTRGLHGRFVQKPRWGSGAPGTPFENPAGLEFRGKGDWVEVRGGEELVNGLEAFTIALWVKAAVTGEDRGIFTTKEPDSGGDKGFGMRYDAEGTRGGGTNVIKCGLSTTHRTCTMESSSGVQTNRWQHLALTWESGEELVLYIDGRRDSPTASSRATGGKVIDAKTLIIGAGPKGKSWAGAIDDVRLYDRVLSEKEIESLMAADGQRSDQ